MNRLVLVALLPLIANCAGSGAAADRDTVASRRADESGGARARGIAAAELPWEVVGRDGGAVSKDDFYAALSRADAVCVGESHRNPHHHWLQLHLVDVLTSGEAVPGALGMEMFQRPFQRVLDDYRAGAIDEDSMLTRTGWKVRWGYDYELYKPIIDLAVERGLVLLALNAPKELTRKIGREGLDALTDDEREQLPELDLDDAEHRAWFEGVMAGHGGGAGANQAEPESDEAPPHGKAGKGHPHGKAGKGHPHGKAPHGKAGKGHPHDKAGHGGPHGTAAATEDRIYAAQVTWDETMAATSAEWRSDQGTGARVIILAGSGHCHDRAIVSRFERRGAGDAVSVYPVIDTGNGEVAAALVRPKNDFIVVMKMPSRDR